MKILQAFVVLVVLPAAILGLLAWIILWSIAFYLASK